MIPFLRPANALPLLFAALLLPGPCAVLRAADDDAAPRHAAAAELLTAMHVDQLIINASKKMMNNYDSAADRMAKQPNLTPEQNADVQKFRGELHTMIEEQLGWDAVKTDLIASYADAFTDGELKELNAFYHSPAGQKLVEKQPGLYTKMGQIMQQKSATVTPAIQQKFQAIRAEVRPTPPAMPAAPVKLPAGSPAESPTTVVIPAASATPAATPTTVTTAPVAAPTAATPPASPTVIPAP